MNQPTTPPPLDAAETLKKLLPNCGFLFEIEDVIYGGTPSHRHPITQDEYLKLMANLYALVPMMRDVARVSAEKQKENCVTGYDTNIWFPERDDVLNAPAPDLGAIVAQVMERTDGTI